MTADTPFDPAATARRLVRAARHGALATLRPGDGAPFASLVAVATLPGGAPVLLLSDLAVHTANLSADPRASLLVASAGGDDPLAAPRAGVEGRLVRLGADDPDHAPARRRYLARHPEAAGYVDFTDFAFWRLDVAGAHVVAGFGRIAEVPADELATDLAGADQLVASEAGAVAHMNEDHADALALYATRLCGAPAGDWISTGLDPDGLDLMVRGGTATARLDFPERAVDSPALRGILVRLAQAARAVAAG